MRMIGATPKKFTPTLPAMRAEPAKKSSAALPLRQLVQPGNHEKSGCLHCPLLCMSKDFYLPASGDPRFAHYQRDPQKILDRLKEPHTIHHRNVSEQWTLVDVLFIGEAPGAQEDRMGAPFVGASGQLLRTVLAEVFPKELTYGLSNMIRCRPPLNRDPAKTELQCCSPELLREIAARKPRVLVPLGNHSLKFATGLSGITSLCGTIIRCTLPGLENVDVVPCLHPAYVLRVDFELQRFANALERAGQLATGALDRKDGEGEYQVLDTVDAVEAWVDAAEASGEVLAFDCETGDLSPFATKFPKLLSISFSNREGTGVTVPLDHPESSWTLSAPEPTLATMPDLAPPLLPDGTKITRLKEGVEAKTAAQKIRAATWKKWDADNAAQKEKAIRGASQRWKEQCELAVKERPRVIQALRRVLTTDKIPVRVAQNEKFDRQHIRGDGMGGGLGVEVAGLVVDSMTTHLTLMDQRGTHGLDVLSCLYTGMGAYHKKLDDYIKQNPEADPRRGGSYANIPGKLLFPYAAGDADATLRSVNAMQKEEDYQSNIQFRRIAETFFPALSVALADMEYAGACIDLDVIKRLDVELTKKIEETVHKIKALPTVRQFIADRTRADPKFVFKPGSDKQIKALLWDYYKLPPLELTDTGFKTLGARCARLNRPKEQEGEKEAAPVSSAIAAMRQRMHGRGGESDDKVSFSEVIRASVAKKEWDFFSTKADVLYEYERAKNPYATLLLAYREVEKMKGTYVDPMYARCVSHQHGLELDYKVYICVHGNFSIIGTLTGRLSCIHGDTLIETNLGVFRADAFDFPLDGRASVKTHNGRWERVTDRLHKGTEQMFAVETEWGNTIKVTRKHWFYTPSGWKQLDALPVGSLLYAAGGKPDASVGTYLRGDESDAAAAYGRNKKYTSGGMEFVATRIVSVTDVGVADVWDIAVEGEHSYVAHGFVNHNSYDPNLQNQPLEARVAYVSRFGDLGCIMQADYSQIELRIAACMFRDPGMIKAYQEGQDVHKLTARDLYKLAGNQGDLDNETKDVQKIWRTRAKRCNFGILYQIGSLGIQTTLKKDGVFISMEEAEALLTNFKKSKPHLIREIERFQSGVRQSGYAVNPAGLVRRVPEVFSGDEELVARALRQITNFPIQSWAAYMTLMSVILVNRVLRAEGFQSMLIATVHDSIVFDCLRTEAVQVAALTKEIMEQIASLSDEVLPGVDWSWFQVPIVAEFDFGVSWGQTVEADPDQMLTGYAATTPLHWMDADGKWMMRRPSTEAELWELVDEKAKRRK